MSLERQDVRAKLDHDYHAALIAICDVDGITIAEFVEQLVVREIEARCHDATVLALKIAGLGIAGKNRESSGLGGR